MDSYLRILSPFWRHRGASRDAVATTAVLGHRAGRTGRAPADCPPLLQHTFNLLQTGESQSLCRYQGKVLLIVNTASFCGYTPAVRRPRGAVPQVQGPRPRRDRLSVQRVRCTGARHQQGDRRILPHDVRRAVSAVREDHGRQPRAQSALRRADARRPARRRKWNFHKYVVDRDGKPVASLVSDVDARFARDDHTSRAPPRPASGSRQGLTAGPAGGPHPDAVRARIHCQPVVRAPRANGAGTACPQPHDDRIERAHRNRRRRHRRPGNRLAAAPPGTRRHPVRGRPRARRPHGDRRRDARRTHVPGRHRLPRVQRPHLPAARAALRRARRAQRGERDVVLVPRRSRAARVVGHRPARAVRPAAQRVAPRVLPDAGRHPALQSRDDGAAARAARAGRPRSASTSMPNGSAPSSATGTCCRWRRPSGPRRGARSSIFRCTRSCSSAAITGCCRSSTVRSGARWKAAAARTSAGSSRNCPTCAARTPVQRIVRRAGHVAVDSMGHPGERFDEVVLACHSDQARTLLADRSPAEDRLLGHVRYQPNRVVLHTDTALLPRRRRAWSAWNYLAADDAEGTRPVAVSYLINKLQPLPCRTPVIVTLNPPIEPASSRVLRRIRVRPSAARRARGGGAARHRARCRATVARGSRAPGWATASTRTAWRPPTRSPTRSRARTRADSVAIAA